MNDVNDNDPDWLTRQPGLAIYQAWGEITAAILEIADPRARDILCWLASFHMTASLLAREDDGAEGSLSERVLAKRAEQEIRLFDFLGDLRLVGNDNPDDEARVASLMQRLGIRWPWDA